MRKHAPQLIAAVAILSLYGMARLPVSGPAERSAAAARFRFERSPLAEVPGPAPRAVRPVSPSLRHIEGWISAVGAAVALGDLDANGLPDDLCHVDTRTDQVIVSPAPGSAPRYPPFTLEAAPLFYRPEWMAPMGCRPADLNEDGWLDLLVYYWGRPPIAFLQRPGPPERPAALQGGSFARQDVGPPEERWYTNAATFADLDGDGHQDLVVGNYFPDGARILDAASPEVEPMQDSMTRAFNGGRNRILRWRSAASGEAPAVAYEEVPDALQEIEARAWTLATGAADLDGDLLPELYFANDFGPDRLFHNRSRPGAIRLAWVEGRKGLTTPNSKVLGRDSFKGMGVDFADLNGDLVPDFAVSNIAAEYSLLESHFLFESTGERGLLERGVAPYRDRSEPRGVSRSGWGWDVKFGDFDNDGVLELLQATGFLAGAANRWPELQELATGNDFLLHQAGAWPRFEQGDELSGRSHRPFFVQGPDGRFTDLAPELGMGEAQVSRGLATADVDGDGALDFAVANQWSTSHFFRNRAPAPGSFLGLRVLRRAGGGSGPSSLSEGRAPLGGVGTPAVGAVAQVSLPDGRRWVAGVDGGNGHSGARSPELHFGLGSLPPGAAIAVELAWRGAAGQRLRQTFQVKPGWHTIVLGDGAEVTR